MAFAFWIRITSTSRGTLSPRPESCGRVEIFLNFMVMDMNMNVLLSHPEKASPVQIRRMNRFWGDESWRNAIYARQGALWGEDIEVKLSDSNAKIAEAYRRRLMEVGGFRFVPEPLPFLNPNGATVYYLFFASPIETGHNIVIDIFTKYRKLQGLMANNSHIEWTDATWKPRLA